MRQATSGGRRTAHLHAHCPATCHRLFALCSWHPDGRTMLRAVLLQLREPSSPHREMQHGPDELVNAAAKSESTTPKRTATEGIRNAPSHKRRTQNRTSVCALFRSVPQAFGSASGTPTGARARSGTVATTELSPSHRNSSMSRLLVNNAA